jgi:hypothetical protein
MPFSFANPRHPVLCDSKHLSSTPTTRMAIISLSMDLSESECWSTAARQGEPLRTSVNECPKPFEFISSERLAANHHTTSDQYFKIPRPGGPNSSP